MTSTRVTRKIIQDQLLGGRGHAVSDDGPWNNRLHERIGCPAGDNECCVTSCHPAASNLQVYEYEPMDRVLQT